MAVTIQAETIKLGVSRVFHRKLYDPSRTSNIVLLHGWSFTSLDWTKLDLFGTLSSLGYNVFAPDYPGFGESHGDQRYQITQGNIENGPLFVNDYMRAVNIQKAVVMGASMGGGIAVRYTLLHQSNVSALIGVAPAWVEDIKGKFDEIQVPTLFVWGGSDRSVPVSLAKEYSSLIKDSKLEIIRGAGHAVYLDRPEEFLKAVKNFLSGLAKNH